MEVWRSEEVAWEMKRKMNPTEVGSVGRGGWCAGHVLIYFQKLFFSLTACPWAHYFPCCGWKWKITGHEQETRLCRKGNERLPHPLLKYATINMLYAKWEYLKGMEMNVKSIWHWWFGSEFHSEWSCQKTAAVIDTAIQSLPSISLTFPLIFLSRLLSSCAYLLSQRPSWKIIILVESQHK